MNTSRYWGANNVFLDPASPVTYDSISNNGQEVVSTETGSLSLTSGLTSRWISHFRAQFSRDRQQSYSNTSDVLVKIPTILDGMGRSIFCRARRASTVCTWRKPSALKGAAIR